MVIRAFSRTRPHNGICASILVFSGLITAAFWILIWFGRKRGVHPMWQDLVVLLGAIAIDADLKRTSADVLLLFASIFISFLRSSHAAKDAFDPWWLAPLMVLFGSTVRRSFRPRLDLFDNRGALSWIGSWLRGRIHRRSLSMFAATRAGLLIHLFGASSLPSTQMAPRSSPYPFETLSSQAMMQYIGEWKLTRTFTSRYFKRWPRHVVRQTFSTLAPLSNTASATRVKC